MSNLPIFLHGQYNCNIVDETVIRSYTATMGSIKQVIARCHRYNLLRHMYVVFGIMGLAPSVNRATGQRWSWQGPVVVSQTLEFFFMIGYMFFMWNHLTMPPSHFLQIWAPRLLIAKKEQDDLSTLDGVISTATWLDYDTYICNFIYCFLKPFRCEIKKPWL